MRLYVDLETRWALSLKKNGNVRCAADHTAGVNCFAWALDNNPINLIPYELCFKGSPAFDQFLYFANLPDTELVAHYAQFEIEVIDRVLGINLRKHRWICTLAKAAYYGYPRSLDGAAQAVGSPVLKDVQGKTAMLKLASGKYTPETAPEDFARLYQYCPGDVEAMRHLDRLLPDLPPDILELWNLDLEINTRGVPIDLRAVQNAIVLKETIQYSNDCRMAEITDGAVQTVGQTEKLVAWALTKGVTMDDCTADTVRQTLKRPLPIEVRQALELRQEAGLSSLAKYETIQAQQVDGRLCMMFDFYGAHTGRWTSGTKESEVSGPQLQNLARSADPEFWADTLSKMPALMLQVTEPAKRLKDALRGIIYAGEDFDFIGLDLAQIEARATAWVAGEERLIAMFASGEDVYCTYGSIMFGRKITKADKRERLAAKAAVLSMGFAGGIGAYQRGCVSYGTDLKALVDIILPTATPAEMAEAYRCYKYYLDGDPEKPLSEQEALAADIIKQRYRRDFPRIPAFWDELENAFLMGGTAGRVSVEVKPSGLRILSLPSGRKLYYHTVEVEGKNYFYQARHGREKLWKGVLMENVAQAINMDVSSFYMLRINKVAPVVHHCHDELTTHVPSNVVEFKKKEIDNVLQLRPDWADGLPLEFDMWVGKRYGK